MCVYMTRPVRTSGCRSATSCRVNHLRHSCADSAQHVPFRCTISTPRSRAAALEKSTTLLDNELTSRSIVVRIGLRVWLSWRRIATPAWMRITGPRRRARPELNLAASNLLQQIRHEERDRQDDRDQNSQAELGSLQSDAQLDSRP